MTGRSHRDGGVWDSPALRERSELGTVGVLLGNLMPLVRLGLATVIESDPGMRLLGDSLEGSDRDAAGVSRAVWVVAGVDEQKAVSAMWPGDHVVVILDRLSVGVAKAALARGAMAVAAHHVSPVVLLEAIGRAAAGQRTAASLLIADNARPELAVLTVREREVFELLALMSDREIAASLSVTVATARTHVQRVYRKLKLVGRADLAKIITLRPENGE